MKIIDEISLPSMSYADARRSVIQKRTSEDVSDRETEDPTAKREQTPEPPSPTEKHQQGDANGVDTSKLSMAAFRAVILAVPYLEQFFDTGFSASFHLTKAAEKEILAEKEIQEEDDIVLEHDMDEGKGFKRMVDGIVNSGRRARLSANRMYVPLFSSFFSLHSSLKIALLLSIEALL